MRHALLLFALFAVLLVSSEASAQVRYEGNRLSKTGPQSLQGPLTLTCATCASGGTAALTIPSGAKLCLDGAGCGFSLKVSAGYLTVAGQVGFLNAVGVGNLDVGGVFNLYGSKLYNSGAGSGGSIPVDDPVRWLSTTTALLESSTAATAGLDTAFALKPLNALAATDYIIAFDNGSGVVGAVRGDGSMLMTAMRGDGSTPYTMQGAQTASLVGTAADGSSAVGTVLNNSTTLSTAGAKLLSVRNAGAEKSFIDKDGGYNISGSIVLASGSADFRIPVINGGAALTLKGYASDGASAVGVIMDTNATLSTSGAKIASFRNATTEKAAIDKDGVFSGGINTGASIVGNVIYSNAGSVVLNASSSTTTCDNTKRGWLTYTQGAAGVKDSVQICAKDAADAYAWRTLY